MNSQTEALRDQIKRLQQRNQELMLQQRLAPQQDLSSVAAAAADPLTYEARQSNTAEWHAVTKMGVETKVVSISVRWDNDQRIDTVEPANFRQVPLDRSRKRTTRGESMIDTDSSQFVKATSTDESPAKKARQEKHAYQVECTKCRKWIDRKGTTNEEKEDTNGEFECSYVDETCG